jgi:hypothetical protein
LLFEVEAVPEAVHTGSVYKIATNVDFEAANHSYHEHVSIKEESSLSVAYLLAHIADTGRDLIVGSREESEFALALPRDCGRSAELISTAAVGFQAADVFQETVIEDLPRVREVVNSGERTFAM